MNIIMNFPILLAIVSSNYCFINQTRPFIGDICPGFSYMTEVTFEEDFASYIVSPDPEATNSDLITYFQKLYTYSPINHNGSCGYVSFVQYLSYYDCFYNDSIIPESYERNQGSVSTLSLARTVSPGVLRQSYTLEPGEGIYDLTQYYFATDYQIYLMKIVNESRGSNYNDYSSSIGMWDYYRILNEIPAFANASFNYTRVQNFGPNAKPTDTNVINWFDYSVKAKLNEGEPVMLHVAQYNEFSGEYEHYHSIVAYYYDELGIHANFGWGPDSVDTVISDEYQITEMGTIDFYDVVETHSHNFAVNGNGHCGCGLCTAHNYSHHYSTYSQTQHKIYCSCGAYVLGPHAINASDIYYYHGHNYAPCINCGEVIQIGGNGPIVPIIPDSNDLMITDNGSFILPNGIYVLSPYDLEDYLAGVLVFHPIGEVTN